MEARNTSNGDTLVPETGTCFSLKRLTAVLAMSSASVSADTRELLVGDCSFSITSSRKSGPAVSGFCGVQLMIVSENKKERQGQRLALSVEEIQ